MHHLVWVSFGLIVYVPNTLYSLPYFTYLFYVCVLYTALVAICKSKAYLQELLKSRFTISRDLNFMLSLSVRINLTATE
jgi:hypothetical protein